MQLSGLEIIGAGGFGRFLTRCPGALLLAAFVICGSPGARADDAVNEASPVEASPIPRVDRELLLGFLANPETLTLIDARSPDEYSAQHLPGAINIPFDALDTHTDALPDDKDKTLVVYCRTGRRAGLLRDALVERGYTNVQVLPREQIFWNDQFMAFNCSTESTDAQPAAPVASADRAGTDAAGGK